MQLLFNKDHHSRINLIMRKKSQLIMIVLINLCFLRILMLLNKRQLEKLKEKWWKKDEDGKKCEKPEDQSDGISIQNIGGVFIVIFVGIAMACITLAFEFWFYKYRKTPKVVDLNNGVVDSPAKFNKGDAGGMKTNNSFGSEKGLIQTNPTNALKTRYQNPGGNFRARF